jgi:hypothetical protein
MSKRAKPRQTKTKERSTARPRQSGPTSDSKPETASTELAVTHDEIAARAFELFLARGGEHGDDWGDWFRAEAELLKGREASKT